MMNCYQDEFDQINGLCYFNYVVVVFWFRCVVDVVSVFVWENVVYGVSDYLEWLKIEYCLCECFV